MDDDLEPADSMVLQDTLEKLTEHAPAAVGAAGVQLTPMLAYSKCRHVGREAKQVSTCSIERA